MTTHNTTGAHQTPEPAQPAETTMTAQTPAQADAHGAESEAWLPQFTRREVVFTMAGVLLIMLLASLDQTIVATALPRIIGELHGFDRYAWVATAYLLTETITVPIYGKLSDLWGRKPIFLFGLVVFLTGSALSGAAPTMNALSPSARYKGWGPARCCRLPRQSLATSSHRANAASGRASLAASLRSPRFLGRSWAAGSPITPPGG